MNPATSTPAGFFVAVSIDLGVPGTPGMPVGNLEGFRVLRDFISHRLTEAGLLLMPLGGCGELNNCIMAINARELSPAIDIIKDSIGSVLIHHTRIAWFDFREHFYRPVYPAPCEYRAGVLIDEARMDSLKGHHNEILYPAGNSPASGTPPPLT